jgi:predicted secreted hydrolase
MNYFFRLQFVLLGLLVARLGTFQVRAETTPKPQIEIPHPVAAPLSYPYTNGNLSFPKDEGKHSTSERPMTIAEWHAHYTHLTAEDGSRYFLFTTFVTFDPVEALVGGKFPHTISTLVDVTKGKTYYRREMGRLKTFAPGHADVATTNGDYFKWRGDSKPFEYDFHVGWRDLAAGDISFTAALKMTKPPLIVNGSGFINLPKGESGYYSQTRLQTKGELTLNGVTKKVSGIQWNDRQWLGMSFAANLNYYYDWWALQLNNNEEAILFRIKDIDTDAVAMSVFEINHADGKREGVKSFVLSDLSNGWQLSAPSAGWELKIIPARKDQGMWQDCDVTGTIRGKPVAGLAAAELARDALAEFRKALNPELEGWKREKAVEREEPGRTLP